MTLMNRHSCPDDVYRQSYMRVTYIAVWLNNCCEAALGIS